MTRWKIFYDDGTSFSSDDGLPEDAPLDGVQHVVQKEEGQIYQILTGDYYYWTGENWVCGYLADLEKWLRAVLPKLKYGRWTKTSIYKQAQKEAESWQ